MRASVSCCDSILSLALILFCFKLIVIQYHPLKQRENSFYAKDKIEPQHYRGLNEDNAVYLGRECSAIAMFSYSSILLYSFLMFWIYHDQSSDGWQLLNIDWNTSLVFPTRIRWTFNKNDLPLLNTAFLVPQQQRNRLTSYRLTRFISRKMAIKPCFRER